MTYRQVPQSWRAIGRWVMTASLGAVLAVAGVGAQAQPALPGDPFLSPMIPAVPIVPAQFDITGFIQAATLDMSNAICTPTHPRLAGGTVTLNGQLVIIPCNTILQMPAFTMTWADLFRTPGNPQVPTDILPANQTGMALNDFIGLVPGATIASTQPGLLTAAVPGLPYNGSLPSYEIHVSGNVVSQKYIAGLVFISQQSLNAGQGVISCIDYATGEMQVGGTPQDATLPCPATVAPGVTRVRINDTIGRYGLAHAGPGGCAGRTNCVEEVGFDPRFTPDTDNPTIHASTGYPMCVPRVNPFVSGAVDPECPQSNRPIAPNCKSFPADLGFAAFRMPTFGYCMTYVMDPPNTPAPLGAICPGADTRCPTDPTKQIPFQIGDNVGFNGTLKSDANGVYVSAHTLTAVLGVYTFPGTPPSYTTVEVVLQGTDMRPVAGLPQEVTGRNIFVGFTTDLFNLVDMFALDQDRFTGLVTERLLGTQSPVSGALLGRFRTTRNNNGAFLPPTRNYRATSRTMCAITLTNPGGTGGDAPCLPAGRDTTPRANGIQAGQYLLPNFEFIFSENFVFGDPLVPNNFQDLPFLFCGSGPVDGPGSGSPVVGQLDPAPWAPPMDNPIFHSTLCPEVKAVSAARVFPVVAPGTADTLTINTALWDNRKNKGKVNLVVTSSVNPASAGMFMEATLTNDLLPAGIPGSTLNPIVSSMVLAGNTPAGIICPTADPCWQLLAPGFIVDPTGGGTGVATLVPPTTMSVRSSRGGTATVTGGAINTLACVVTRRQSCGIPF